MAVARVGRNGSSPLSGAFGDTEAATSAADEASRPRDAAAPLPPGHKLGRYMVLEVLGRGGMGIVYAAYDPQLDRRVALKLLRTSGERAKRHTQRLLREAQAMARLSHPNVIAVHDVGTFEGEVFLAMEFVEGGTLGEWIEEGARSWTEVREAYVQAGRGLAAAHAAGLVHRDFKPDNVLIDREGRVRVTDFGLARADDNLLAASDPSLRKAALVSTGKSGSVEVVPRDTGPDEPDESRSGDASISQGSPLALRITQAGARLGTPGYMAPEQHVGDPATAPSDQFSFCVALYEGFFGRAPFAGSTLLELTHNVLAGKVRDFPRDTAVPAPIRRAILRGLSARAEDRFPSMNALLEALAHDPGRRRRVVVGLVGVAALMALAAYAGASTSEVATPGVDCTEAGLRVTGLLDEARSERIEAAFAATGRITAGEAWTRAEERLVAYADRLGEVAAESCRAQQRGAVDGPLYARQSMCITGLTEELDAQLTVLEDADVEMLDRTAAMIGRLRRPEDCADLERLQRVQPMPDAPEVRQRIEDAQADLAKAKALLEAGRRVESIEIAQRVVDTATLIDWTPLTAEALLTLGDSLGWNEQPESALDALRRATEIAARSGDADLLLRAWRVLALHLVYEPGHHDEVLTIAAVLESLGTHFAMDRKHEETIAKIRGSAHIFAGELEDARKVYETLLDGGDAVEPDASLLNNYGVTLLQLGDYSKAAEVLQQAIASEEREVGTDHPNLVERNINLALIRVRQGEYGKAERRIAQALSMDGRLGDRPLRIAVTGWVSRAEIALAQRRTEAAREAVDMAMRIAAMHETTPGLLTASVELQMARVDVAQGRTETAMASLDRLEQQFVGLFGAGSSEIGLIASEKGQAAEQAGDLPRARTEYERAVELLAKTMGSRHPLLGPTQAWLGLVLVETGETDAAEATLTEAVATFERVGGDPGLAGRSRAALAELLVEREPTRAVELARRGAEDLDRAGPHFAEERAALKAWIEAH